VLKVADHQRLHANLDYDNFGARLVGHSRAGITMWVNNVGLEADRLYLRSVEPFPSDSDPIFHLNYTVPIGYDGMTLGVGAARAKTVVGGEFTALGLNGRSEVYDLTLNKALERTVTRRSDVSLGLVSKTVKNLFADVLLTQDDLRILQGAYSGVVFDGKGQTSFRFTVSQGLNTALGGRPNGDPLSSRLDAGNAFTSGLGDLFRLQRSGTNDDFWIFRGSFQIASGPLTVAEQFALGGATTVRGFAQSEALGDDGYLLSVEYRHLLLKKDRFTLFVAPFIDHASSYVRRPQPGEPSSRHLTGAGLGLRAGVDSRHSLRFDVGLPINQRENADRNGSEFYAQLVTGFD
jgi:hemolysin activation/secretion protein